MVNENDTENRGNFLGLVHLHGKYDSVLCEHVTMLKMQKKIILSYLSPEIQKEFIHCLGNHVRTKILAEVREAKNELDIQNCRGQAYDNAAVMSGRHSGVQMRIKAVNQNAQFVACTNHSLNLVGVHAASIAVDSVSFFGSMEKVFNYFSSSTHCWKALTGVTGQGFMRLIETQWSSRYEAVSIMKTHYAEILEVLESLAGNTAENAATRSDAGLLLNALQSLSFLAFLGLWSRVLVDNRDVLVNDGFDYAKNICEDLGIEITLRRIRNLKIMAGEKAADAGLTYENRLRQEMFESRDRIIQEIKTRFQQLNELDVKYSFLTPTNLLNPEYKCKVEEEHCDIDVDGNREGEVAQFRCFG
ncbi:unnamed protein product [Ceutorhynchus assimilis]|uniref:DUF4371 domain-containing protein n=1 Tax=Ceutorhynchus assimilis TaxID=467358 RepID=A0A9N9MUP4_9CUCU|nr:unnamed protein product [Ceutorhynchus assimilis]